MLHSMYRCALISALLVTPLAWPASPLPLPAAIKDAVRIGRGAESGWLPEVQATGTDPQGNIYLLVAAAPGQFAYPDKTVLGTGPETVVVIKIAPATQKLVYLTGIAGPVGTFGGLHVAMCVAEDGSVFLAGFADSTALPTIAGSFKPSIAGSSGFILKLGPSGHSLVYSTFLDSSKYTRALAVAVDSGGNAYVAGATDGVSFPVTTGAYRTSRPASGYDPRYIGDSIGFIAKVDPLGRQVLAATFLGGDYGAVRIDQIALDANQQVQVRGWAESASFPTTPGAPYPMKEFANDAFLARFSPDLTQLRNSTLLPGFDWTHVQLASNGSALLISQGASGFTLVTFGPDGQIAARLPLTHSPLLTLDGDQFLEWYSSAGAGLETRDTLFPCLPNIAGVDVLPGGIGSEITVFDRAGIVSLASLMPFEIQTVWNDSQGRIFVAAFSQWDAGTELVSGILSKSLLIFRLDLSAAEHGKTAPACVTNGATFAPTPMVPGTFATIFGSNLGPQQGVSFAFDEHGLAPKELAGMSVAVGGIAAPMVYVQDGQINFLAPDGLAGESTDVCVRGPAGQKCLFSPVGTVSPGVFQLSTGYAVLNQDGSVNTSANPAQRGTVVQIFGTGMGPLVRPVADGAVVELPLNYLSNYVGAWFQGQTHGICAGGIGGMFPCTIDPPVQAEVQYSGAAPFLLKGVDQINVRIPVVNTGEGLELRVAIGQATYARADAAIHIAP